MILVFTPVAATASNGWCTCTRERDYRLADIVEFFQLGKLEEAGGADEAVLVLTGRELQTLKTMADTFSFDYEEEFIEMCLEVTRLATGLVAAPDALEIRFTEYF